VGSKIGLTDALNRVLDYPMQARRMGIEGTVRVDVWINEDASLGEITLVSGIMKECDADLIEALKNVQPLWIPGTSNGSNVKSKLAITVDYQLAYVFEDLAVTVR
jgi:periplasmic protein TonB